MIQLVFDAASPRPRRSTRRPAEVGYSQHEGAERATWDDDKLELVGGTHPGRAPGGRLARELLRRGAVHRQLGLRGRRLRRHERADRSTSGRSCGRSRATRPRRRERSRGSSSRAAGASSSARSSTGPPGRTSRASGRSPISGRRAGATAAIAVPGGGALGTGATDFFCSAVAAGSRRAAARRRPARARVPRARRARRAARASRLSRTTWRPGAPLRLARRRAWGQMLTAAGADVRGRGSGLFLGIGLVALADLAARHAAPVGRAPRVERRSASRTEGEGGGVLVLVGVGSGTALTLLGLGLVQAATARALVEIDEGRHDLGRCTHTGSRPTASRPLLGARSSVAFVVSLLASSLVPRPDRDLARRALGAVRARAASWRTPRAVAALRRSGRARPPPLVQGRVAHRRRGCARARRGPAARRRCSSSSRALPLALLNVVAGVVYAVAMPFVALTTAYVYFDMRVRDELPHEASADTLPAEIERFELTDTA